jgi:transglutaminase-like putative cysteine protease
MYDIKQFRPAVFLLILLGFTGYGLAAEAPGIWALSVLLVVANAWFVKLGLFKPMPRLLAFAVALIALLVVFLPNRDHPGNLILGAGEFLVLLQLVKVWELRGNRDYGEILILSVLLMVAAAISTASLLFGVIFVFYLFLSLYCCLLFHLKFETDEARRALAIPSDLVNPATLRQDQRHLPRSMRRLTVLVAIFSITFAVLVFLLFPRGPGAGMFMQMQPRRQETLTGFSDHVDFQTVASIAQNETSVAQVQLFKNGAPQGYTGPLLLRGATHDLYTGAGSLEHPPYTWERTQSLTLDVPGDGGDSKTPWALANQYGISPYAQFLEKIEINPIGTLTIFAMQGPVSILPENLGINRVPVIHYSPVDETLQFSEQPVQRSKYSIYYTGTLGNLPPDPDRARSNIDPLIAQYALRDEVTGGLGARRKAIAATQPSGGPTELDELIARNIESYLRNHFEYTLDLTAMSRIQGRDPVVAFLYDFKKGHCEYFAGAMTLLCQSLGMDARMVVGFKCDEYNNLGAYYNVRQSHAHAWVEVFTPDGWKTFDPTSGHEAAANQAGLWAKTRQLFDFLQYTWQDAVIAYDSDNRENLIQNIDNHLANTTMSGSAAVGDLQKLPDEVGEWLANRIAGPLIGLLTVALIGSIGWYFFERLKLRRRASRIGIRFLPAADQFRLVRQLAFYDELLQLLARHRIDRPDHLTPLEFSEMLSFLPSEAYDRIYRLTKIFYRIRYGQIELNAAQQRRLANVVAHLSQTMQQAH